MSSSYALKISPDRAKEIPMVDLAFEILKAANTPFYYRDLMFEIAKIRGLSDDDVIQVIAQVYTEINIDGRFACVGSNLWGLKRWYPVEKGDESMGATKRPRIINDEDDDLDDDDLFEEEDDVYGGGEEDFDSVDSNDPYGDSEVEEVEEGEEEVLIDDTDLEDEDEDDDLDDELGGEADPAGPTDEDEYGDEDDAEEGK